MQSEAERLAARTEVEKKVREIAERVFEKVGSTLDAAPWQRLDKVIALVSMRVGDWLGEHPELAQAAVEHLVVPVVEELAEERMEKRAGKPENGKR
jgi:hypothetical protein